MFSTTKKFKLEPQNLISILDFNLGNDVFSQILQYLKTKDRLSLYQTSKSLFSTYQKSFYEHLTFLNHAYLDKREITKLLSYELKCNFEEFENLKELKIYQKPELFSNIKLKTTYVSITHFTTNLDSEFVFKNMIFPNSLRILTLKNHSCYYKLDSLPEELEKLNVYGASLNLPNPPKNLKKMTIHVRTLNGLKLNDKLESLSICAVNSYVKNLNCPTTLKELVSDCCISFKNLPHGIQYLKCNDLDFVLSWNTTYKPLSHGNIQRIHTLVYLPDTLKDLKCINFPFSRLIPAHIKNFKSTRLDTCSLIKNNCESIDIKVLSHVFPDNIKTLPSVLKKLKIPFEWNIFKALPKTLETLVIYSSGTPFMKSNQVELPPSIKKFHMKHTSMLHFILKSVEDLVISAQSHFPQIKNPALLKKLWIDSMIIAKVGIDTFLRFKNLCFFGLTNCHTTSNVILPVIFNQDLKFEVPFRNLKKIAFDERVCGYVPYSLKKILHPNGNFYFLNKGNFYIHLSIDKKKDQKPGELKVFDGDKEHILNVTMNDNFIRF